MSISFDDESGVALTSPNGLSINAGGGISIKTHNSIKYRCSKSNINDKGNTTNEVSIESEFHITANNVIKNGSCREVYAPYEKGGK